MDLTDEQWTIVEPPIPKPKVRADGRGRPCATTARCWTGSDVRPENDGSSRLE